MTKDIRAVEFNTAPDMVFDLDRSSVTSQTPVKGYARLMFDCDAWLKVHIPRHSWVYVTKVKGDYALFNTPQGVIKVNLNYLSFDEPPPGTVLFNGTMT